MHPSPAHQTLYHFYVMKRSFVFNESLYLVRHSITHSS
uniref:Uncharacterized protein n=1 Tax=Anguilla anguilla TaxID=7936 RepID=A0A0E9PIW9_ANGAN